MPRTLAPWLCGFLTVAIGSTALAFDPPIDRAGPLVVRIEGPKEVTRLGAKVPIRVLLENTGAESLKGTVTLGLIDRWTASPSGPLEFSVAGKTTVSRDFSVVAGSRTYSALYPIHAVATFVREGKTLTAHPVLIVETKLDEAPRANDAPPWKPWPVPAAGQVALWSLPSRRVLIQVVGQKARVLPPGWQGRDEATFATVETRSQVLGQAAREVLAIHPPWRDGRVGTSAVEVPLALPAGKPIALRFENAVVPEGQGDGVTFRVRVVPWNAPEGQLGAIVFERHSAAKRWGEAAEADLSRFAGQSIRLQLESHPGPKNDTGWDQSFWAEPTLAIGRVSPPPPFPPKDFRGALLLGSVRSGQAETEVRLWPGQRGLLDTVIGFSTAGTSVYLRGFLARVHSVQLDDPRSPLSLTSAQVERSGSSYRVRHHFEGSRGAFELMGELTLKEGVLRAAFRLENGPAPEPWQATYLEDVALGPWSRPVRQVYAGHGNVVRAPEAFTLAFDGHQLATSFVGFDFADGLSMVQGVDVPPTRLEVRPAERHGSLHASHSLTFTLIPTANVFEAVKLWREVNGLKPSGGVKKAAGRFVVDLWGGRYADAARELRRSARYGLRDAIVVWHNWQRWGYDNRLPDIYPPNPELGTLAEMKDLIAACRESGTLFAPHDNYIDFYPDAEGFSYEKNIAFDADGRPVKAWLNEGRGAQSYRFRADRIEPFLGRNLGLIRSNLAPTAYFIDVWSSILPYDYWTADGAFHSRVETRNTWGELFARIRRELGDDAPQISESGHDQLIGWLDGAQANHLRVDRPVAGVKNSGTVWNWRCADAERTPWFDAAHHDRFVLHGAGYPSRYEAGLDPALHGINSDDYMATEVLTGHPAMSDEPFGQHVVRKFWLLDDLMRALALRRIEAVEYVGGDLHRQHVRWSGGGEVWVNRGETDWQVAGQVLPSYGFLARVPTTKGPVEAAVVRRSGLIVESSRSPERIYVNGRSAIEGRARIRPVISEVRPTGGRGFAMDVRWEAEDPLPEGYVPFFHVCNDAGEILFQAGQEPPSIPKGRTGSFRVVAKGNVPEPIKPGTKLELRVGLYQPGGPRLPLAGPDDGQARLRVGRLAVEGQGNRLTGLKWSPNEFPPDPTLARRNPAAKPVDFGAVETSGGVRLEHDGRALLITPLPGGRGRTFDVRLRSTGLPWPIGKAKAANALAEDGKVMGREPVRLEGGGVVLTCRAGVFRYQLLSE